MEKRKKKRFPKRLFVKFGVDKPDHVGFTQDISAVGIFIKSSFSFPPSTRLKLELTLPGETVVSCPGVVRWAKKVPPALARLVKKSGMAVTLIEIPEEYKIFIDALNL